MDFLIKNVWLEQAAAHAGIDPSAAEVQETFIAPSPLSPSVRAG
jgi:hypothetical protein